MPRTLPCISCPTHYRLVSAQLQAAPLISYKQEIHEMRTKFCSKWDNLAAQRRRLNYITQAEVRMSKDAVSISITIYTSWNMKHFIHSFTSVGPWSLLQFPNPFYTHGRTPWTGDKPVTRTTQTQTAMPWVGFEPTIPAFKRAKTVDILDGAATMIGKIWIEEK
jgi:hypothetical protein